MEDNERAPALNGEEVLNGALAFLRRFTALPSPEAYVTLALWAAHTWAIDALDTTPRLLFRSSEPASGKSFTMEMLSLLCAKPRVVTRIKEATLFQLIDLEHPTLFLDEADTIFRTSNSEVGMQAVLNSGFGRGVPVPRTDGKTAIKDYDVFGPVALASLRPLPAALASRAIQFPMVKRSRADVYDRRVHAMLARQYADAVEAWALSPDVQIALSAAETELPAKVIDRDADKWRPLIAIADQAGGQWPVLARQACRADVFGETASAVLTPSMQLLRDLRTIWSGERMSSEAVIRGLLAMEPWSAWPPGSAYREIAALLSEYDITPRPMRISGKLARGYDRADLDRAWAGAGLADAA
jgi:hypothetical protein